MKTKTKNKTVGDGVATPTKKGGHSRFGRNGGIALAVALAVALTVLTLHLTAGTYPEYLIGTADYTPFFTTSAFFSECMLRAGGLLFWAASALTSCFHDPWLGASLFALLLVLLPFVLRLAFRVPWQSAAICFIPSALLLANFIQLGYMMVTLTSHGIGFAAVLGVYVVALTVWAETGILSISSTKARRIINILFHAVMVAVAYPLFGFWGTAAVVLSLLTMICNDAKDKFSWVLAVAIAAIALVYPDMLFRYAYTRVWEGEVYTIGLPKYEWSGQEQTLWYPLLGVMATLVLIPLLRRLYGLLAMQLVVCVAAVLVFVVTPSFLFSDPAFYSTLRMTQSAEQGDWEGVIREARSVDYKPTRLQGMIRMLAQIELGTGPDEMFAYEEGDSAYASPRLMPYAELMGSRYMYYNLGKVNFCYRWCMEDMVAYGQRPTYLKFMTKCALVNGEPLVAEKYIDALRNTWQYRDFADKYEAYVRDTSLISKDKEMRTIRTYAYEYPDILDSDGGLVELYLVTAFSRLTGGSLKMGEMSLLCNLIKKDLKNFWTRFYALAPTFNGKIPRHYQEAAYMLSQFEKDVDISNIPIDPSIPKRFQELVKASQANGNDDAVNKVALRSQFGDTYWFYYFFSDVFFN